VIIKSDLELPWREVLAVYRVTPLGKGRRHCPPYRRFVLLLEGLGAWLVLKHGCVPPLSDQLFVADLYILDDLEGARNITACINNAILISD